LEADSQTIVVDWVADVEPTVHTHDGNLMILQRCEWHAAEAIKKKLIKKGYKKERRDKVVDLLWKWIKTADLNLLDMSRANLLLALQDDEKEYLTNYYQPKEPSFCRAYTSKYPNLGCHSTQRNEKIHDVVTVGLSKNIPVGKAIEIICDRIKRLPKWYDDRINKDRLTLPRLLDKIFFKLCSHRFTHYCLTLAMVEYANAKAMLDEMEINNTEFIFEPKEGCQISCELPLRYGIPCKCWMSYFYLNDLPLPANLFDPRWLLDGPESVKKGWKVSLDNEDYDQSTSLEQRYAGDRFADRGGEMILQTAVRIAEQHKNLPPEDAERFAFAFKELNEKLANRQNEKLKNREEFPAKFPEPQLPAKLTYLPGRKRALTGREVADQQEADDARARRNAERIAAYQAAADSAMDEDVEARTQLQEDAATAYLTLKALENGPSSEDENDGFVDIDDDVPECSTAPKAPSKPRRRVPEGKAQKLRDKLTAQMAVHRSVNDYHLLQPDYDHSSQPKSQIQPPIEISDDEQEENLEPQFVLDNAIESDNDTLSLLDDDEPPLQPDDKPEANSESSDGDNLPDIEKIFSQHAVTKATQSQQTLPAKRVRKITSKQQSQERHAEEKKLKKEAKLKKKPKTSEISQLLDLPFRSSQ
jgi:hypothetical protein